MIADLDALFLRFVGEQLIERGARHVESRITPRRELVRKIEFAVVAAVHERRAVLVLKAGSFHRVEHAGLGNEIQAVREQALAYREPWELLRFEQRRELEQLRRR